MKLHDQEEGQDTSQFLKNMPSVGLRKEDTGLLGPCWGRGKSPALLVFKASLLSDYTC